jgi:hypothetical protein
MPIFVVYCSLHGDLFAALLARENKANQYIDESISVTLFSFIDNGYGHFMTCSIWYFIKKRLIEPNRRMTNSVEF